MVQQPKLVFDPLSYLAGAGVGKTVGRLKAKQTIFAQGDPCDAIYYIHSGRVKLSVVSSAGKEATITLLGPTDSSGKRRSQRLTVRDWRRQRP